MITTKPCKVSLEPRKLFPQWRLIPFFQAAGSVQMAIDAWLFDQHQKGNHPPTLRFYGWSPIALSLGYHQRHYPSHWDALTWKGEPIDLVHRPTGGRAVLHQGDLTYAIVTSGMGSNRSEAYRQICEFLILGWRSLGVDLHYGQAGRGYIHKPNCFETATGADLVLNDGRKLIGSAQRREGDFILQHGSIRLNPNPELFERVFGCSAELPQLAIDIPTAIETLCTAASQCFGMKLIPEPLSDEEWRSILQRFAL